MREAKSMTEDTKTLEGLLENVEDIKKRAFLETYLVTRQIKATAEVVGVARRTFYNWVAQDQDFKAAFNMAYEQACDMQLEDYLENIRSICFDKSVPPQSRLLGSFFEVKKLDPSYRDRQSDSRVIGDITIHLAIPLRTYDRSFEEIEAGIEKQFEKPLELKEGSVVKEEIEAKELAEGKA